MVLFLVIVGGLLELAGIGLALREVHQRRRDAKTYEDRTPTGSASGRTTLQGTATATATASARIGPPPTLEQRIAALEQALSQITVTTQNTVEGVVKARTTDLRVFLTQDIEGVRRFTLKVTRPTWSAWTAIGLLVTGLALQTAANVVQLLSSTPPS